MALRVVGAGLGRTGTNSLKLALEQLLGGPCYHMYELRQRPGDLAGWEDAVAGRAVAWQGLFDGFAATVDWPAAAFWKEIVAANPEALVLLSSRESSEVWWTSIARTIVPTLQSVPVPEDDANLKRQRAVTMAIMRTRLTRAWPDRGAVVEAYERHNEDVRSTVPSGQLIDWQPGDGWEPICTALAMPAPAAPFPHENTTADFRALVGLDG
jgi:Sulfotransferase domain